MTAVGFDNTMLSLLLNPKCILPRGPDGKIVAMAVRRAEYLVERLGKSRRLIIIPTPAMAELLTVIGHENQKWLEVVAKSRAFEISSFDPKSAIELSILNREVFRQSDKKNKLEPYQKVKVDRQIIAVLKAAGIEELYTDDDSFANRARMCGITPIFTHELPIPETERQLKIEFKAHDDLPDLKEDDDVDIQPIKDAEQGKQSGSVRAEKPT